MINTFGKDNHEAKILDFVLNAMTMIYQEPYEPIKQSRWSLGFDGKFANLKADITKTMKDTGKEIVKTVEDTVKI